MKQPQNDKIASLKRQLAHYVSLLQEAANNYFFIASQQTLSAERSRDFKAWHAAYRQLQEHLQNPERFAEKNATEEDKKQLIITAKNIAINTTTLFKTLAETPETGDDTYNPTKAQLKKVEAITTYHQKCQVMPESPSILQTLGRVALGVTLGALGFVLGAACGAAIGAIFGLGAAVLSGGHPAICLLAMKIGAAIGAVCGGAALGYTGFMLGWSALAPKLPDSSKEDMATKAFTFADTSMTFFAKNKPEKNAVQRNTSTVNTPRAQEHNSNYVPLHYTPIMLTK